MNKMNCWEVLKCGRESESDDADAMGVCPAASEEKLTGINGGKYGGRSCWAIARTFCNGEVQGTFALKLPMCQKCEFYIMVKKEESSNWQNARVIFARLAEPHNDK